MVLYISTGYWVLGIECLDQLKGARHTHISYHNNVTTCPPLKLIFTTDGLHK